MQHSFFRSQADSVWCCVFPACPLSFPTNAEWTDPSAEHSAADSEGGGGGAAWFVSGSLQEDSVGLPQCHLSSPEQDGTRLQGIHPVFIHRSHYFFNLWLGCRSADSYTSIFKKKIFSDSPRHQNQWDWAAGRTPQWLLQHPVLTEFLHPGNSHRHRGGLCGGREWHWVEDGAQDDGVCQVPGGSLLPAAPPSAAAGWSSACSSEECLCPLLDALTVLACVLWPETEYVNIFSVIKRQI